MSTKLIAVTPSGLPTFAASVLAPLDTPDKVAATAALSGLQGLLSGVQWQSLMPIFNWAMAEAASFHELLDEFKSIPAGPLLDPKVDPLARCGHILAKAFDTFPRVAPTTDAHAMIHGKFAKLGDGHLISVARDLIKWAPTIIMILNSLGVPVPTIPFPH